MRAKTLTILLGAIVALSAAAPGLLGMQAQRQYNRYVDQLAGAGYQITDRIYARGWFSSDAGFTASLPVGADGTAALHFRNRIAHGPFLGEPQAFGLARIDSELRVGDAPLLVGDGRAPVRTAVGLRGDTYTVIDVPARQLSLEAGAAQLESGALTGELRTSAGQAGAAGHLSLPLLRLRGQDGASAELTGLRLDGGMRRSASGLALGEWRLAVDAVGGSQAGAELRLAGLEVVARSDEKDGLVGGSADYRLRQLTAEGATYGPMELRVAVSRLPAEALARIQQAMDDVGATSDELRAQAAGLALLSNADALLAQDPVVALERLQIDTPEGRVEGQLELRSVGLRLAQIKDANSALRRIEGKASLRVPEVVLTRFLAQDAAMRLAAAKEEAGEAVDEAAVEALAEETAREAVAGLVGQELLVRDAGQLVSTALWRNGLLTVNGKTVPITLPSAPRPGN